MQPLHHPHGLEACWKWEMLFDFIRQLGHVTSPNPLLYGLFTFLGRNSLHSGPPSTLLNQLQVLAVGVKEICVSVGTRSQGRTEAEAGEGPLRAPGFPASGTWIPFLDQWRALCRAWQEDPEGCRLTVAPGSSSSTLHGRMLAHRVPAAAPGVWNSLISR